MAKRNRELQTTVNRKKSRVPMLHNSESKISIPTTMTIEGKIEGIVKKFHGFERKAMDKKKTKNSRTENRGR